MNWNTLYTEEVGVKKHKQAEQRMWRQKNYRKGSRGAKERQNVRENVGEERVTRSGAEGAGIFCVRTFEV